MLFWSISVFVVLYIIIVEKNHKKKLYYSVLLYDKAILYASQIIDIHI